MASPPELTNEELNELLLYQSDGSEDEDEYGIEEVEQVPQVDAEQLLNQLELKDKERAGKQDQAATINERMQVYQERK